MRPVLLVALAAASVLLTAFAPSPSPPAPDARTADVRERVERAFRTLKDEGYAGSVAVTYRGVLVYSAASGESSPGAPFRTDMASDIFSISKPVTAMAVVRLSEQGRLSLDDPLSKWFPEAPPDKAGITLQQLLIHEAGLVDTPPDIDEDYTRIDAPTFRRKIFDQPLRFAPGTDEAYCNSCYSLLAMVVEKASGRSFFAYLQDEVLAPAGVTASYDPASFPVGRVSNGRRDDNGVWTDIRTEGDMSRGPFWFLWGAGGLYATMPDLARLADAFAAGRIVSPAGVALMLKPHEGRPGEPGLHQGLGWVTVETQRGTRYVWHNGGGVYGGSSLRHYPEAGLTIATVANSTSPSAYRAARELAEAVLGPDDPPPTTTFPDALPQDSAEAGLYRDFAAAAFGSAEDRAAFMRKAFTPAFMGGPEKQARLNAFFDRFRGNYRAAPAALAVRRSETGVTVVLPPARERDRLLPAALGLRLEPTPDGPKIKGLSFGGS